MERVLAVFAHPDDEALCVGTLANHSDAGSAVRILWLSQGERTSSLQMDLAGKIRERKRQSREIGDLLGVETDFLDFPDAAIEYTRDNALRVAEDIRAWKPTIVLTWNHSRSVGTGHPDHRHTHSLVLDAVSYARYTYSDGQEVHREAVSLYLTYDKLSTYPVRLVDVSSQEEKIREFFRIYTGMYGKWPVEEAVFSTLRLNGMVASCKLAEALHYIQQRKADTLLI